MQNRITIPTSAEIDVILCTSETIVDNDSGVIGQLELHGCFKSDVKYGNNKAEIIASLTPKPPGAMATTKPMVIANATTAT